MALKLAKLINRAGVMIASRILATRQLIVTAVTCQWLVVLARRRGVFVRQAVRVTLHVHLLVMALIRDSVLDVLLYGGLMTFVPLLVLIYTV